MAWRKVTYAILKRSITEKYAGKTAGKSKSYLAYRRGEGTILCACICVGWRVSGEEALQNIPVGQVTQAGYHTDTLEGQPQTSARVSGLPTQTL